MKKILKKFWDWKIKLIRDYPVWCAYGAWVEGFLIALLIVWIW